MVIAASVVNTISSNASSVSGEARPVAAPEIGVALAAPENKQTSKKTIFSLDYLYYFCPKRIR
ncbi:MAG: hypothetical protein ACJAWF_001738 [Candidatus Azotimanducaceae bacterium]